MHADVRQPDGSIIPVEYDCNTCSGAGTIEWGYFNTKAIQIEPVPVPGPIEVEP